MTMKQQLKEKSPLIIACHPFIFALREGVKIQDNLLDYSLLLLQQTCTEVLRSPASEKSKAMLVESRLFQVTQKTEKLAVDNDKR